MKESPGCSVTGRIGRSIGRTQLGLAAVVSPRNARITDDVACRDGDQAGIDTSVDELRDRLRRRELSTDVDALLTEFYKQLRETVADDPAVKAAIGEADVADRWDAIATELDELEEVSFADEESAAAEITAAIK